MSNAKDATIGDILGKEPASMRGILDAIMLEEKEYPLVLQPETPTVDRMLDRFNKQWEETAMECVRRAEELEAAAVDLRDRAERLLSARELTAEVKGAVLFEINARNRAASLALVNPT